MMMKKIYRGIFLFLLFMNVPVFAAEVKNILLFIGDGMGFEQVKAAGIYANGSENTLCFEYLPENGQVKTYSANAEVTDSAAAATAMATGIKVNNGVISVALPGDESELETLLELFRSRGKRTGLVTVTTITHATPAAFGAHEISRNNYNEIATDYLGQTCPNILFGGGENGMSIAAAETAGYTVVTSYTEMDTLLPWETLVSGQFGASNLPYEYDYYIGSTNLYDLYPHLSEMSDTALDILNNDPDGFFIMVEGGNIDTAGHANSIERNVFEVVEFANTVQAALIWAENRNDTAIFVTADHETGGLTVLQNNGQGNFPDVSWTTTGHTGVNVPYYTNIQNVSQLIDNTEIYDILSNPGISIYVEDDIYSNKDGSDNGCFISITSVW